MRDAGHAADGGGHEVGERLVGFHAQHGDEVVSAGHRVHLGDAGHVAERFGHGVDLAALDVEQDKGGDHGARTYGHPPRSDRARGCSGARVRRHSVAARFAVRTTVWTWQVPWRTSTPDLLQSTYLAPRQPRAGKLVDVGEVHFGERVAGLRFTPPLPAVD